MTSTSKRNHKKSRLGCRQCKSRRVKCDERPPCCGNCSRKGLECEFQAYAAVFDQGKLLTSSDSRQASSIRSPSALTSSVSFSLKDMGLLHHFTLHTCETLPVNNSELYCHIWRQEVPRLAQSYDFLMHAIIAFAAAHQAAYETDPNLRDLNTVRLHFGKALNSFRDAVQQVRAELADPVLAFTILTCFLTLWLEREHSTGERNPIWGFANLLEVIHGSNRVLEQLSEPLRESTVGVLLSHTWYKDQIAHPNNPVVKRSLDRLMHLASEHSDASVDSCSRTGSTLIDSVENLRKLFTLIHPRPTGWEHILSWPVSLPLEFSQHLRQENPIAMCALAHWCVPANHAPSKWYTGDWPKEVLVAISKQLHGSKWIEGIRWPLWACDLGWSMGKE